MNTLPALVPRRDLYSCKPSLSLNGWPCLSTLSTYIATPGGSEANPFAISSAGRQFLFFFTQYDFVATSRARRSPFFGGTSFKFWRRCCFLRSRLAWIQEGWVLWQLKLRCISQPAARYSLSNLWYGRGAVSLPFSPSKNPSLTRIYQGAQSYHPKVTVDALSVRRIFSC